MSDNPELISVGVEDDGSLEKAIEQVAASTSSMTSAFLAAAQATSSFNSTLATIDWYKSSQALDDAIAEYKLLNETVNDTTDRISSLSDAYKDYRASLQDAISQEQLDLEVKKAQSQATWDQVAALQAEKDAQAALAPTESDFGGDEGSGGGGSLFGVARGLRAGAGIGRLAGAGGATTGALTGAADVLYLEQAFAKLQGVLPGLVESATAASPAVQDLAAGLTSMGVPAAGLLAVLGPLAVAVGAVAAVVLLWNAELADSKALLDQVVEAQNAQIKVALSGKTTDQVNQESDNLQKGIDVRQKLIDQDKAAIASGEAQAIKQFGLGADKIFDLAEPTRVLQKEIDDLSAANVKATADIQGNTQAINNGATAQADADAAAKVHQQAIVDAADRQGALRKQEVTDLQGSSDTIQKRIAGLQGERQGLLDGIDMLQKSGDTSDATAKKINNFNDQITVLDERVSNMQINLPDIKANEDAAAAAKKANKEFAESIKDTEAVLKSITDAQDKYDKTVQRLRDNLANAVADLSTKETGAEYQYTPGSTQDTFARDTIALKEQRDVAKIEEDTGDKIADIRTKLGETESKIVTDYNRQIFDDQIKYQDDVAKLVTDEHRQEQVDAIDHANRLASIRQQATDSELDDVANRDFAKLARDQRSASEKIQQENTNYALTEEKQRVHLANAEADLATHLAQEERLQQTAEGRKLADAETSADNQIAQDKVTEQRKIEAAQDAQAQQLADLNRNELEKITLLRQSWYNQYEMLIIQENQREQIAYDTEQAIVNASLTVLNNGVNAILTQGANAIQSALHNMTATAVGVPSSSVPQAPSNPMIFGGSSASPASGTSGTLDYQSIINGIGSVIQGMLGS